MQLEQKRCARARGVQLALRWTIGSTVVLAAVYWVAAPMLRTEPALAVANIAVSIAFAATAALMFGDADQRGNAWLLWGTALFFTLGYAGSRHIGPIPVMHDVLGPLAFGTLAAVLLRYPEQRLRRGWERGYVVAVLTVLPTMRLVSVLFSLPEWHRYRPDVWWPTIIPVPSLDAVAFVAYQILGAAFGAAFVPLIICRVRRAAGIDRRMLRPVMISASAIGVAVACETVSRIFAIERPYLAVLLVAECVAILTVPTAFLIATIHRRLSHANVAGMVQKLSQWATPDQVRAALRESLSDPQLEVAYWLPDLDGYFTVEGRPLALPDRPADRFTKLVHTSDGQPLAVITIDGSLRRYPGLLDAAVSAATLALENGRLQAELRAQVEQLRESRARIVGAADAARRRLERDLHDGAQQRLLAMKMRLATVRVGAGSAEELELIDWTRAELQDALDELRALARGLHPAILTQSGLRAAVMSVAERLPLSVEVDVPARRWEPGVEATAYYVACECLANTVKHSAARRAAVLVIEQSRSMTVEVFDDGKGGADVKEGGGLLGLRDRVSALGGELTVVSPVGTGTRIAARIPCE